MTVSKNKQTGVTLLEGLLFLVIVSFIVTATISRYELYQSDRDIESLKTNIDDLFSALNKTYQINCQADLIIENTLPTDLKTQQLLPSWPFSENSLVESSSTGYITYLKKISSQSVTAEATPQTLGTIEIWELYVAIKLKDPNTAGNLKNILGAFCVADDKTTCTVKQTGDYLIFKRLPNFTGNAQNSNLWPLLYHFMGFTQMYRVYPILMRTGGTTQYYRCGG